MSNLEVDVVVVGAGIAGASIAALLAESLRVAIVEREAFPGVHSTGRSAALFSEIYGGTAVRALSRASREFLYAPPDGFTPAPLVKARGALHIASASQIAALDAFCALPDIAPAVTRLTAAECLALCPILRPDQIAAGAFEAAAADVDVDALHQGFLRVFKARGGTLLVDAEVTALRSRDGEWVVAAGDTEIAAATVVNAAGAWADDLAVLAGARPIGLQPRRRTALIVEAPPDAHSETWPMVIDIDEQFYFRPNAGALLLSPADETPSPPCDAQPDEWDIAVAVDRVTTATTLEVRRVRRSWAGLRSFAPDRAPVVGYAADAPGFFWLAGQGGYGIQTAPAMAALAAALVTRKTLPAPLTSFGVEVEALRPGRF
jgi:D-arginine dehydrogenase